VVGPHVSDAHAVRYYTVPHLSAPPCLPCLNTAIRMRLRRAPTSPPAYGHRVRAAVAQRCPMVRPDPLPLSTCGRCLGPSSTSSPQLQKGHSAAAVALFPAPFFSSKCCRRLPSSVSTAACPSSSQLDPRLTPFFPPTCRCFPLPPMTPETRCR
jgi:hypothetical protein